MSPANHKPISILVLLFVTKVHTSNNNQPIESCDPSQTAPDTCTIQNRIIDIPAWQIERNRRVTALKMTSLQSENLPVNVGESFPNLLSYEATDTSPRVLKKENLRHLRVLEVLSITNGQLIRVRRDTFDDLPSLQRLDLGHNFIKTISPENFREIQKLEFLSLKNNEIEELSPRIFRHLLNLKEFQADSNKIATIAAETFANNRRLKVVSMSRNVLKFVDATVFSGLKELQVLDMSGNECVDKEYRRQKGAGGLLDVIRTDMTDFCQIGVKN